MPTQNPPLPHRRLITSVLVVALAVVLGIIFWNMREVNLTGSVLSTTVNGQAVRYGSLAHGETVSLPANTHGIFQCPSAEPVSGTWANAITFGVAGLRIYEYAAGFPESNKILAIGSRYPGASYGIPGKANTLATFSAGKTYYVFSPTTFTFYCSTVSSASSSSSSSSTSLTSLQQAVLRAADWNHDGRLSIFEVLPQATATIGAANSGGTYDAALDVNTSGTVTALDALQFASAMNNAALTFDPTNAFLEMYALEEGNGTVANAKTASNTLTSVGTPTWTRATSAPGSLYALQFDGIDDRLSTTNTGLYNFSATTAFSVSAWVRTDTSNNMTILGKTQETAGSPLTIKGWQLVYSGSKYEFNLYASSSQAIRVRTVDSFAAGTMRQVFVSYSGNGAANGVVIYVDGMPQTLSVVSDNLGGGDITTTNGFAVGFRDAGGTPANLFKGTLDEIVLLSAARTPTLINREPVGTCGDGLCIGDESNYCASDCFGGAVCGDGTCHPKEIGTCSSDCGLSATCTDTDLTPVWGVRGMISRGGTNPLFDYCQGGALRQYNCANPDGDYVVSMLNCPSGCVQGVCR